MAKRLYDRADVVAKLKAECRVAGSQRRWADLNHISDQYVCDVLQDKREPGEMILKALCMKRVIYYQTENI